MESLLIFRTQIDLKFDSISMETITIELTSHQSSKKSFQWGQPLHLLQDDTLLRKVVVVGRWSPLKAWCVLINFSLLDWWSKTSIVTNWSIEYVGKHMLNVIYWHFTFMYIAYVNKNDEKENEDLFFNRSVSLWHDSLQNGSIFVE